MRKTLIAIVLALALVLIPVGSAFAQVDVTVTATPGVLSFTVVDKGATPAVPDWPINDVAAGDGIIRPDTLYFANPLGDETAPVGPTVAAGECYFTFDNTGNLDIDITCNMIDFSGGDTMDNKDGTGYLDNGATTFGASGYYEGGAWAGGHVPFLSTGSGVFINALAVGADIDWGVALTTRSDVFTSATPISSTITCTAIED